jgi:hypothetical protein
VNYALALLLCVASAGPKGAANNLDFSAGKLTGWQGNGFYITTATGNGPTVRFGVCSSDNGIPGRMANLERTFAVPSEGGILRCTAFAEVSQDGPPDGKLDLLVVGPDDREIPKRVFLGRSWTPTKHVLTAVKQKPQDYQWDLAAYRGKTVRIVLKDEDARPGCYLFCGGFQLVATNSFEGLEFGQFMVRLAEKHDLAPMTRYDSKHFAAITNADQSFSELHLRHCETIYTAFYDHFRDKGFQINKPSGKLMVAVFDTQGGFEAYLGQRMPPAITGLYDRQSNRLVVYDFGQNSAFLAQKQAAQQASKGTAASDLERQQHAATISRRAQDFRSDANVGTIMHEVAHQLSFNSGMLNREGDVPLWLGEGLACYCEATDSGSWLGIGEPNQERILGLIMGSKSNNGLMPLETLIESDDWLRGQSNTQTVLLGYAQSWALFRMLMEQRPKAMQSYLELIKKRKTPDYRVDDFRQAFGKDLEKLQNQHLEYVKQVVQQSYKLRK